MKEKIIKNYNIENQEKKNYSEKSTLRAKLVF